MKRFLFCKFIPLAIFFAWTAAAPVPAHSDNLQSGQPTAPLNPSVAAETCSEASIRCVGAGQEYSTIQAAVNAAVAGDTVLVFDGDYAGFEINKSGQQLSPITIKAAASNAVINSPISGMSSKCNGDAGICLKGNGDLQGVHDIVIEGFKIRDLYRCISSHDGSPETNSSSEWPHRRITIRGIRCTNAGHEGFYLSEIGDSLIEGNTISNSGANSQQRGHGIYLANAGSDNTIIRGNVIYDAKSSDSAGIHFNGDLSVGGDGIISGLLVENNVIYGGNQNGLNMDGVQDSVIRNNVVHNNANHALHAYAIDGAAGPRNMRILNNTFIAPSRSSDWALRFSQDEGGHVIFNNILIKEGSGGGSICVDNANFQSDYNIVGDRFSRNDEGSTINLASWRSFGKDANSLTATSAQLFVDPGVGDYHLLSNAPAIDRGIASFQGVSAPVTDLAGAPRPQGILPDIGAYESGSDPTRPASPRNLRIR